MKLCLDASESFQDLALFSVGIYFWANVTNPRISITETPISGPSRVEMLISLVTIKNKALSSISFISPLSEQALPSPSYFDIAIYNFSSLGIDSDIKSIPTFPPASFAI